MARNYVRDNVPLSRFGVLVAQLESIVASAVQQSPEPLLCFDLLSDLIAAIDEEPKVSPILSHSVLMFISSPSKISNTSFSFRSRDSCHLETIT